ncbi:hypothetical protein [Phaffia rhodozyma]|uniref:Uncharacterized protein n=1 Tax=Phaffia rhodozyma TaxID=264483 RepID=A0A0F7SLM6_PHARH|nr:hypothetical protein [Phaffia rhodozyma]
MPFFPYPDALLLPPFPHRQPLPTVPFVEYDILNPFAHTLTPSFSFSYSPSASPSLSPSPSPSPSPTPNYTLSTTLPPPPTATPAIEPYTGTPVAVVILTSDTKLELTELLTISQELNLDDIVFAQALTPSSFRIQPFYKHTPVRHPGPALSIAACWSLLNRGALRPTDPTITQVPHEHTGDTSPVRLQVSRPFNPSDPIILVQADLLPYTVTSPYADLTSIRSLTSTSITITSASSVDTPIQTYLFVQLPFQTDLDQLDLDPEQIAGLAREFTIDHTASTSVDIRKLTVVFWAGLKIGSVGKKRDVLTTAKAFTQTGHHETSSGCASLALALTFALSLTPLTPANGKTRYSFLEGHRPPSGRRTLVEGSIRLDRALVSTVTLGGRVGLTAQGWILCPRSEREPQ